MRVVELRVPIGDLEVAADRLWCAGARAVEEFQPADGFACLRTVLAADDDLSALRLGELGSEWTLSHLEYDDEPAQTWREFVRPVQVSPTLMIAPAWQPDVDVDDDTTVMVVIEPDAAFGLGDHPTTQLTAAATERLTPAGGRVLDVGCGTGVLGIVAAMCGAAHVVCVDIAMAAVEATTDNARRNDVDARISVSTTPVEAVEGTFDLVLANILAPALVSMAPSLRRLTSLTGTLVISGVLEDQFDHVVEALRPMVVERVDLLHGWAAVELRQPPCQRSSSN